jgi:hypothetical protein
VRTRRVSRLEQFVRFAHTCGHAEEDFHLPLPQGFLFTSQTAEKPIGIGAVLFSGHRCPFWFVDTIMGHSYYEI